MRYHNITTDDMLNGDGLRVVLWLAGCEHHCQGCQNPLTWDPNNGLYFDKAAIEEIYAELGKNHISGLTISGGDPLHPVNSDDVLRLVRDVKLLFFKTVWLYTGYLWEEVNDLPGIELVDVLVDGPYIENLRDDNYPWAGSTNQRVIDVQRTLELGSIVLHKTNSCIYY